MFPPQYSRVFEIAGMPADWAHDAARRRGERRQRDGGGEGGSFLAQSCGGGGGGGVLNPLRIPQNYFTYSCSKEPIKSI